MRYVDKLTNYTPKLRLSKIEIPHVIEKKVYWYVGRGANIQRLNWTNNFNWGMFAFKNTIDDLP